MRERLMLLFAAVALVACEGRRTVTGVVAPIGLTVRVHVASALAPIAQALGWPGGVVPGATVVAAYSSDNPAQPSADTAMTDAAGSLRFGNLLSGSYTLHVSRSLTPDELTRAGSAVGSVDGFAGAVTITLRPSASDTIDVELSGVGAGSLAFSEIFGTLPLLGSSGGVYYYGSYLKIYNNADTTIQLAGKLFFIAWAGYGYIAGSPAPYNCNTFAAVQDDPSGLWADFIFRFPDTAQPLAPGKGALIATDAIDHTQIRNAAGFFDLSRADFEFKGDQDAHNPLAQGMLDVGPRRYDLGHGWESTGSRQVFGLAGALDINALPMHYDPVLGGGSTLARIPKEALLDVLAWDPIEVGVTTPLTLCPSAVVPTIDAAEALSVVTFYDTLTMHRRVSRTLPSGRIILQQSHNSAADWYAAPGTPYKVP